jgi:N-acylglucosamine 2-epimerase
MTMINDSKKVRHEPLLSSSEAKEYCSLYQRTLLKDVVPFWIQHGFDEQYGGINNILDDAGNTLNYDKYLWSQGRALWTFSALYNRVEKRAEWLRFADHIFNYLRTHGRDEHGRWMYRLDKKGNVLDRDLSIMVDGFVMNGMGEYYAATGNREALRLALETQQNVSERLERPGSYGLAPYEIPPGLKNQGVRMLFSFFFFDLGLIAQRPDISDAGLKLAHEVLDDFYIPSKDAVLEFVSLDGKFVDSPAGRTCVPGHAIEALWFLITIFERTGDEEHIALCCRLIKRHLELAWDEGYGGLKLALDIDGREPVYWQKPDYKPWWVQVEALVATAYAHLITGEEWCMEWHERIRTWAYDRYPVSSGEWTQWLDRFGNKAPSAGLPVKDPFHLPRTLMYLIEVFERIESKQLLRHQ